jgi:adhesin HecA-like repeat protein
MARAGLEQNDIAAVRSTLHKVLTDVNVDSTSNLTGEAYALIRYNTDYLLGQLPQAPPPGLAVRLVNSSGSLLTGGSLQYYEGSWKDAINNGDGTFTVNTNLTTVSLRMTYAYGSQTKSNVPVNGGPVTFQTVNAQVKLQNSQGVLIDTGTVQYYAGAWRTFGSTSNGVASTELLPANYSFRMMYAFGSNDKQQDIGANPAVVFQTVNTAVQLKNSQDAFIDQGSVQYYAGAWRAFGVTSNGVATKELLPASYSFRMTYAYGSNDKQQNIGSNPAVVFQTVSTAVQLQNSQGTLIDQGTVQYYAGAWRDFGSTTNGVATKELLPNTYSFRMSFAYASKDKQQNIGTNPTVVFNTVNAAVQLKNSLGNLIPAPSGDQGTVQYYAGAWRSFGTTTNGSATKELLPNSYSFRMTYEFVSNDKTQDIGTNSTVSYSTVLCTVKVTNMLGQPVDGAQISYYSGAWRAIGPTVNGQITKELLPANLSFRMSYGGKSQDKQQNLLTSSVVEFVAQ